MKTPLAACLVALLSVAPAAAQQNGGQKPPAPDMDTGHSDQRLPQSTAVSEKADQILAHNLIGAPLFSQSGERLGTIKDALVHRPSSTVDVLVLDTGGANPRRTIAWSAIDASDRRHLTTDLTKADIEGTSADKRNGKAFEKQAQNGQDYVSIADGLIGKDVVSSKGEKIGSIDDLVIDEKDAKIVAALIGLPGVVGVGAYSAPRAVPWSAARLPSDKGHPITLNLTKEQVAAEPRYATKAPEASGTTGNAPVSGSSTGPRNGTGMTGGSPTLDLGGKPVAPPGPVRRSQ